VDSRKKRIFAYIYGLEAILVDSAREKQKYMDFKRSDILITFAT